MRPGGHRRSVSQIHQEQEERDPLYLIRGEIAVMKKLHHENLVQLIEVLDDPEEDSMYMVLEMCKKGVVMKVDLNKRTEPYPDETCWNWFRDLILGIEYLHAQGIVHRDIKPDNLLLMEDNTLKISDFGVSEIFEQSAPMKSHKGGGSPAFLPPELCETGRSEIDGPAIDIWAMGICLYCLKFGRIPFEKDNLLELSESIRTDELPLPEDIDPRLKDLLQKMMQKDPSQRIKMPELRAHPWVTDDGNDNLLSTEENTANLPDPPTEEEVQSAIGKTISQILMIVSDHTGLLHISTNSGS
jgi:[calcium/calmodulin-dependent protein kinase] kinase